MKFRLFSKPQPRPPYVIALEISQFDIVGFSSYYSVPPFPPIPAFSRFVKDWDDEEELLTAVRSLSTTDYINDPYHKYLGDVLEYIHALREYTGEGGICPAKPPIAEDLPKGLNEIGCSPSPTPVFNDYSRDLMDDTCPVCYEYFKDENEVITTNCLHEFHIHCMIKWLSMHNTCPTCRADYPLHYSPLSNCRKRPHHNILEEPAYWRS